MRPETLALGMDAPSLFCNLSKNRWSGIVNHRWCDTMYLDVDARATRIPPDLEMRIMKAPYTFQAGQRVRTPDGAGVCIAFNPRWFGPDSGFGVVDLDEGGTWEGPGADITLEATA